LECLFPISSVSPDQFQMLLRQLNNQLQQSPMTIEKIAWPFLSLHFKLTLLLLTVVAAAITAQATTNFVMNIVIQSRLLLFSLN
jgi:hypothetical protein